MFNHEVEPGASHVAALSKEGGYRARAEHLTGAGVSQGNAVGAQGVRHIPPIGAVWLVAGTRDFYSGTRWRMDHSHPRAGGGSLIVLATFCVMGEIDVSATLATHVTQDEQTKRISLGLIPYHYREQSGAHILGCVCAEEQQRLDCARHTGPAEVELSQERFGHPSLDRMPHFQHPRVKWAGGAP